MTPRPVVGLSRPLPEESLLALRELADVRMPPEDRPADLADVLRGADHALVTPYERIDDALLDACPTLRRIITVSAGYDHIDVAACASRGIEVANTPGAVVAATADHAFGLLLAASRRIVEADAYTRSGSWSGGVAPFLGQDVHHSTLGIVGMGRIGQQLARRAHGFDMEVVYHGRRRLEPTLESRLGVRRLPLEELLAHSDAVILQVSYSPGTHHLLDERRLALMKPSAVLVNTSRGGVVDDAALARALSSGRLAGAGLDVFEGEPHLLPELRSLPNVVLTPHLGAHTVTTHRRMAQEALTNLIGTLRGAELENRVTP
ncbi:Glyoxylate reductase [Nostocoides japonicum T1-X7]|uniref:Glyoxylate reductase n=1 Tax=Nostocoides japonicum T1-X7 TaxID=1194083 RepID=A0A077M0P9_9MICO|nr:D-glycerate dehydrogenase [Tetrasphaera japonica]CCH79421.1 Glyoxylate reductase [Tetrasphaera japonica T1-X7]